MQWDSSPNAGFCPPDVQPWLPVADDYQRVNVAAELQDERSALALNRALLALRGQSGALRHGSYRPVETGNLEVFVYERQDGDDRKLIALNFTPSEQRISLPGWRGAILLSTLLDRQGEENLTTLTLRADEGCIIQVAESP
jgi:alpha-glucosidase